ncbi:MFS family major facilitator transporter [Bifidobacterium sp. DSM 109958]|uniref:MFS family major facilitator transporter n=1 Tax=Bifidobacterium moraviense TaxID=2675323 RepID=A0A7Y0HZG1_9BIFI|nr:MFS transporter [Bifidobacterium sp. DSM 109958]NMN01372.1 MFS family major facilitator transporter [Bifidobacterium sp. DSM 109958]
MTDAASATPDIEHIERSTTGTPDEERIPRRLLLAILATGIMAFIGILTETLMNVLFPELMAEFHIGTSTVQWLTTGYLLVVALVTPLSSYLKRRVPLRTIFLIAIGLCIAGCLIAACTINFPMLLVARILQGAGTGMALPLMFNIILEQSPRSRIGTLMGVGNMVCAAAPALGPTVGGIVGTTMPWRWIFVILLPFLLIALVLGLRNITQMSPTVDAHLNPLHVLCVIVGFVSFIVALDQFGAAMVGTGSMTAAVALLAVAAAAMTAFGWLSKRSFSPLVRLGVLRSVPFRWHLLAYVLLQMVTIGFGYMIPNSAQLGFGASALVAGVIVLPGALIGAVVAPISGSLLDRFGAFRPVTIAMTVALLGTALMALLVGPGSTVTLIGACYLMYMVGFSMSFANTMTSGLSHLDPALKADGNALFSTFQQLSGAVGTTVMSVFLSVAQAGAGERGSDGFVAATQQGAHWGYVALTACVACAFLANLRAFAAGRVR